MKTTSNAWKKKLRGSSGGRFLRRFVKNIFSGWMKQQTCVCEEDLKTVLAKLQDMEESIDVIEREVSRQGNIGKRN